MQVEFTEDKLPKIIEAFVFAADEPLSLDRICELLAKIQENEGHVFSISRNQVKSALEFLTEQYQGRGVELAKVASGYRFQTPSDYASLVNCLWDEKPQKYSRALLETLALIAYRQPITRGDIEEIRGVAVSSNIMKTLLEREWVRVIGHREVPGRPAIYATTRKFLDYFNLHSLDQLPALAEIRDLDEISRDITRQLELDESVNSESANDAASDEALEPTGVDSSLD